MNKTIQYVLHKVKLGYIPVLKKEFDLHLQMKNSIPLAVATKCLIVCPLQNCHSFIYLAWKFYFHSYMFLIFAAKYLYKQEYWFT